MNNKINIKKILNKTLFIIYTGIILLLYILFLIDDFFKPININNTIVKYLIIIIINIFSFINLIYIFFCKNKNIISSFLLFLGLSFTLVSDTFLLLLNNYYLVGVSCFIVVQISYMIREFVSFHISKKRIIVSIFLRIITFIVGILILNILSMFEYLYIVTLFYFINLVFNFIDSTIDLVKSFKNKNYLPSTFLSIGLFLFILCDISVGLYNLFGIFGNFMWLFYCPSQLLISLSGATVFNFNLGGKNENIK